MLADYLKSLVPELYFPTRNSFLVPALTGIAHVSGSVQRVGSIPQGRSCQLPPVKLRLHVPGLALLGGAVSALYLLLRKSEVRRLDAGERCLAL